MGSGTRIGKRETRRRGHKRRNQQQSKGNAHAVKVKKTLDRIEEERAGAQRAGAQAIEHAKIHIVEPGDVPIKDPVHVCLDGKGTWVVVDRSALVLPHPVNQLITPDWAVDVIENRNPAEFARKLRRPKIDKYKQDMLHNNWHAINQGIGFYPDGLLGDGQHRLHALVEVQMSHRFLVAYGMSRDAMSAIDEGTMRTDTDVAKMLGYDPPTRGLSISNFMLRTMLSDRKFRTTPRIEKLQFFDRHRDAIAFVVENLNRKKIGINSVLAVLARAYYTVDRERLTRFMEILREGRYSSKKDQAAWKLSAWLGTRMGSLDHNYQRENYRKTETALKAFVGGRELQLLRAASEELFPLPEED